MEREFREIALSAIRPSPLNPRKKFENMDRLTDSVRASGVIEPILVRPLAPGESGFEIVAGERRYRAASAVASENGGPEHYLMPCMVQILTDDEAFELMSVENLQREDLTELEEAKNFQQYQERKGEDALPYLAERLGISPQYVRRRVSVLSLPEPILEAWEKGDLRYGHLEQLARLNDRKEQLDFFKRITDRWQPLTVVQLKFQINQISPPLKKALFDKKAAGCPKCRHNSTVQKTLFGDDYTDLAGHCLNPKCFKQSQNNWLLANWEKFKEKAKIATNGFRFRGCIDYEAYEKFYGAKPRKACLACEKFISIIEEDGSVNVREACLDKKCMNQKAAGKDGAKEKRQLAPGEPRVNWHGEYFRQRFYETAIPERYNLAIDNADEEMLLKLQLFILVVSNQYQAQIRFGDKYDPEGVKRDKYSYGDYTSYTDERCWQFLLTQPYAKLAVMMDEVTLGIIMDAGFQKAGTITSRMRHQLALALGIDLAREWRIDAEYLEKKTVAEIHAMAEKFGFWKDAAAHAFVFEKLGKKRGAFASCKKGELVRIILESGLDLAGKVPDEILKG